MTDNKKKVGRLRGRAGISFSGRGRIGRPIKTPESGERVTLGLRVTADMKGRLGDEAVRNGRSLSQEAEIRLEQSFKEEDAFGGPQLREIAHQMAGAFARGGRAGARARGHPKWPPATWMQDPYCFKVAMKEVGWALAMAHPKSDRAEQIPDDQRALWDKILEFFSGVTARQDFAQHLEGDEETDK